MPRLPLAFNFDLWLFRNLEEVAVGKRLEGLRSRATGWRGIADFHRDAILWRHSRLPNNYKRLKKAEDFFWSDKVRVERREKARTGEVVQWHRSEAESVKMVGLTPRWVPVPRWFAE